MKWSSIYRICAFCVFFAPSFALAQSVTVTRNMDFGQTTLIDNGAQRQIAFQPDGSYHADSQYYFLDTPVIAHVEVRDYPPNADLDISFNPEPGTLTPQAGMGSFTVDDFFTIPATVNTGPTGNVDFDVGAVLRSDGATSPYGDTRFSVPVTITVEEIQ